MAPMYGGPRRRRGRLLSGLGIDLSQYNVAQQYLAQTNQQLLALEAQIQQNPSVAQAIGADEINARNRYSSLLQYYIMAYQTATGSAPDVTGLEGLGQWQVYVAAGVGIAVIVAALVELQQYISGVLQPQAAAALATAQASSQAQANTSALTAQAINLQNQANAAAATGDTATAANLQAQANALLGTAQATAVGTTTPAPGTFSQWLSANWPLVAGAGVALFLLKDL